jgi:hypothetical protein
MSLRRESDGSKCDARDTGECAVSPARAQLESLAVDAGVKMALEGLAVLRIQLVVCAPSKTGRSGLAFGVQSVAASATPGRDRVPGSDRARAAKQLSIARAEGRVERLRRCPFALGRTQLPAVGLGGEYPPTLG